MGIALVVLVAVGVVRWNTVHLAVESGMAATRDAEAQAAARALETWFADRRLDAERTARLISPFVGGGDPDFDAIVDHLLAASSMERDFPGLWLVGPDGDMITDTPESGPLAVKFVEAALGVMVTGEPRVLVPILGDDDRPMVGVAHPVVGVADTTGQAAAVVVVANRLSDAADRLVPGVWLVAAGPDSTAVAPTSGSPAITDWVAGDAPLHVLTRRSVTVDSVIGDIDSMRVTIRRAPSAPVAVAAFSSLTEQSLQARSQLHVEFLGLAGLFLLAVLATVSIAGAQNLQHVRALASMERDDRRRFEALFDYSNDGVVIMDVEGTILDVNARLVRMLGFAREDMIGAPIAQFHAPGQTPGPELLEPAGEGPFPLIERELRVKNGGSVWVEVNAARIPGTNGEPDHIQSVVRDLTDRKRTEQALRDSGARWRSIAETPFEMVSVIGPDHCFQMINNAPPPYTEDMFLGRPIYDFIAEAHHDDVRATLTHVFETGQSSYQEAQSPRSGKWYAHAAGAIRDDLGVTAVSLLSWDITELHEARDQVAQSRDHYRALLDSFPLLVWVSDAEGNRTYVNDTWIAFVGRERADELGNGWAAGVHPDDLERWTATFRDAAEHNGDYGVEFRLRDAAGEYRIMHETGRAMLDADGQFVGYVGAAQDVTERRQLEEQHRLGERRLKEAQHVGRVGSWEWSVRDGTVWWSEQCYELLGYDPHTEATFDRFLAAVHPDDAAIVQTAVQQCLEKGSYESAYRFRRADGTIIHVRDNGAATFDDDGNAVTMSGTVIDVTAIRAAEAEVRDLNATLEARVEHRTRELARLNEELESFSYSVSHDLRAPLRAMHGFASEVLKQYAELLPREGRRLVGNISDAATTMQELIDRLLEFSRLARSEMRMTDVSMNALVAEVLRDDPGDPAAVSVGDLPDAHGDAVLLRQVWSNLLSNARKFTSTRKQPAIEIGGRIDPTELQYWIRDNGVGFPTEYAHRIFTVFDRLHGPTEFPGHGVGLASVQRIVARHGGRVTANGSVDGGAIVGFALPRT